MNTRSRVTHYCRKVLWRADRRRQFVVEFQRKTHYVLPAIRGPTAYFWTKCLATFQLCSSRRAPVSWADQHMAQS